jgi:hypothetical protein
LELLQALALALVFVRSVERSEPELMVIDCYPLSLHVDHSVLLQPFSVAPVEQVIE